MSKGTYIIKRKELPNGIVVPTPPHGEYYLYSENGILIKKDADGNIEEYTNDSYVPTVLVGSLSMGSKAPSQTFQQKFFGTFMDAITNVSVTGQTDSAGVTATIVSKSFNEIIIEITVNAVIQTYNLILSNNQSSFSTTFITENFTQVIPSLTGSGNSLWIKPNVTNNDCVLTTGGFEAENNNGDGWNDHAYFGTFTSATKLAFEFDILELQDASNAYCFIRFNNTNNASTSGNPRVYAQNGSTFLGYASNGSQFLNTQISEGDNIEVIFTPTTMEIFKNGQSLGINNGTYNLNGIYMNFTAYRVFKIENITAKIF